MKNKEPDLQAQMAQRYSAPRPTAQEELNKLSNAPNKAMQGQMANTKPKLPIGREQVRDAQKTLNKYKEGKANLEQKIVENEEWYKLRHWECLRKQKNQDVEPVSAWLHNCIENKLADAMDNYPAPNILPREESDKGEAEILSSIIPVILEQNDFESVYNDTWLYKLKTGVGVYGIFWDAAKHNGLGDISIRKIDLLNLYWESGITDIQDSRNVFHVKLADNEVLVDAYPQLEGKLGSMEDTKKYYFDDSVDTTNKSVVVDWYYKKQQNGKTILHYCKYVNDEVLYATENEMQNVTDEMGNVIKPSMAQTGLYDHGRYPFFFDVLFPMEGTPIGFGYIDIGKSAQEYIDRGNQSILKNMLVNASPRYFINASGSVNEDEYRDLSKDLVHVNGALGQDSIVPIKGNTLNDIYVSVLNNKIDELKETTGNRDISTGGTTGGVTASSAIAAMQEAGSKTARKANKSAYRVYRKMCEMIIELIRQFYDLPRQFRIVGPNGAQRFISYSNANLQMQAQGMDFGADMGFRLPVFDVEITAQKQSPYSKMSQNELALQFYQAGFFNPQMADAALLALDMMDFDRKHAIMQKIAQNGTMYQQMMMMQQQLMQLSQIVDATQGTNLTGQMVGDRGGDGNRAQGAKIEKDKAESNQTLGGDEQKGAEPKITKNARKRVAESTSPT